MRENIGAISQFFGRPIVAAALATVIVLGVAAFAGLHLQTAQSTNAVAVVDEAIIARQPNPAMNVAAAPPAPSAAPANGSAFAPQIARTGKVSLFAGNVDNAVAALSQLAKRQSGDVFSLQLNNADAATKSSAAMDIRIPADRFDQAMNAVGQIGKVRERTVGAEDLTSNITDSSARLRNLRQTEADIRKIMDRSGTIAQVLEAENQLSQVREQIETLESDLKLMRTRVAYATISISVESEAASAPVEPTALSQLSSAWSAAIHQAEQLTVGIAATLLWLLVFVPYIALAAVLVFVVLTHVRKRVRAGLV